MIAAFATDERGPDLLLRHCAAVAQLQTDRPPARYRLEAQVGRRLAGLLVFALAGDHTLRPRERLATRRGCSSP